jgi:hypothetical protein
MSIVVMIVKSFDGDYHEGCGEKESKAVFHPKRELKVSLSEMPLVVGEIVEHL